MINIKVLPTLEFASVLIFCLCSCVFEKNKSEYDPDQIVAHIITYTTEKGSAPKQIALADGASLKAEHLPPITAEYFMLDGWYFDDEKIEPGYVIKSDLSLTAKWILNAYEYKWIDTSGILFTTSTSANSNGFFKDGEYTKITSSSGTSSKVISWMLSYDINSDGKNVQISKATGFEAKIKCSFSGSDDGAGIQWHDDSTKSSNLYWFKICSDGRFEIKKSIGSDSKLTSSLKISASESNVKTGEFNRIKVEAQPNGNTKILINDKLVCTFGEGELEITPGRFSYAYSCKSSGNAWIQLLSYQQVK